MENQGCLIRVFTRRQQTESIRWSSMKSNFSAHRSAGCRFSCFRQQVEENDSACRQVGASRAFGLPRAAADAVSGRKPGPTLSAEQENAAVPCTLRRRIPPCCPCAALCEAIGRRTTPCTDKPVRSRCTALVGERREQKIGAQRTPYFPFLKRILIPRKIFFCPWFRLFRWN